MKRLAIISSHPIQYNAPAFAMLARSAKILIKVFYTWEQSREGDKYDPGFGRNISWDIPLLEGYDYTFVPNTAERPGSSHFKGIVNPSLIDLVEEWKPDLVLVYGWSFQSHLQCLRHFHGKLPVLFRGDSTLLDEKKGIRALIRRVFLKWVYKHVDFALYVGTDNKNYFLKHGLKGQQLIFAPHAIDNERFAEPDHLYSKNSREQRAAMGIDETDVVALFAGKLESKKDPFVLLELSRLIDDPAFKIVIVGNGPLETSLKSAAEGNERILFMDFQNQTAMPVVYRIGDFFILPSSGPGETWGLAVNEAMACSKPVIVSDRAGCAIDLVQPNENGIIFSRNDLSPLASFILSMLKNRGMLQTMGQKSAAIIKKYSFGDVVLAIEHLSETL